MAATSFFGGEFFGGEFFNTATADTVDTHDGGWPDEKRSREIDEARDEAARLFKEDRDSLRSHLERAMYGDALDPEITAELEALATPQLTDSVVVPLVARIDFAALEEKADLIARIFEAAAQREEQEEEDLLLLMAH